MLYSVFSGITVRQNKLICVVLKNSQSGWKIQDCLTYPIQSKNDWKSVTTELNKHLPKWRNCVAISLEFEEVLRKSSVINSSLCADEESSYVREQLSQVLGQDPLAYDYRCRADHHAQQDIDLFICKQETLDTLLNDSGLSINVVGWALTDLVTLSQQLLSIKQMTAHYALEITDDKLQAVSLDGCLTTYTFDLNLCCFAELVQSLRQHQLTLNSHSETVDLTLLLFGTATQVEHFLQQVSDDSALSCIDASLLAQGHIGEIERLAFERYYPALGCALGAMSWCKALQ
ncbi:hypothetical protein [Vibrio ezurae]|uniref:Uncharacterized protein n=1 Tax=Vibrio ezurae NBRC 102218 TaxID=1219080 RepID=U3AKW8_9VIBR|nr:hypothetical protein [Vibrio ezurae]GAD80576.1 hypothetical protein VEZ01S_37_01410 [Vibrio ezurae NBRC 102218]